MLGEILRLKPTRLILFPERGLLQVEFDNGELTGKILTERVEDYGNIVVLKYSEKVASFKVYALLWDEVEFYIKRGIRVEEFRGNLMERWERHLKGWDFEEVDNIIGKVYIAHKDVGRGKFRFLRVGEEVKKIAFPPKKNLLAVFKGEHNLKVSVEFLRRFFEGARAQFKSPGYTKFLENYILRVVGDSIFIFDVNRATFRVIYDKLMGGRFSVRRLSIPLEVNLPEKLKEKLEKFGFKFLGNRLVSVPDLPVNISVDNLEDFAKTNQNLEDEETLIRNLSRALSVGKVRNEEELLSELFMCKNLYQDPEGRIITMRIPFEEIRDYFGT